MWRVWKAEGIQHTVSLFYVLLVDCRLHQFPVSRRNNQSSTDCEAVQFIGKPQLTLTRTAEGATGTDSTRQVYSNLRNTHCYNWEVSENTSGFFCFDCVQDFRHNKWRLRLYRHCAPQFHIWCIQTCIVNGLFREEKFHVFFSSVYIINFVLTVFCTLPNPKQTRKDMLY